MRGNHRHICGHHAEGGISIRHPVTPIADRLALLAGAGGDELALRVMTGRRSWSAAS